MELGILRREMELDQKGHLALSEGVINELLRDYLKTSNDDPDLNGFLSEIVLLE